jgi:hypothetical protein
MTSTPEGDDDDDVVADDDDVIATVVSPGYETSCLLSSLLPSPALSNIGDSKFVSSHCINLERLVMQSFASARMRSRRASSRVDVNGRVVGGDIGGHPDDSGHDGEEYVVDAIRDDVTMIVEMIKTLLTLELWRLRVLFDGCRRPTRGDGGGEVGGGRRRDAPPGGDGRSMGGRTMDGGFDEAGGGGMSVAGGEEEEGGIGKGGGGVGYGGRGGGGGGSELGPISLASRLATNGNAIRASFVLHVETSLISLLGLVFYRGIPPELSMPSSRSSSSRSSCLSSSSDGKDVVVGDVGGRGGGGGGGGIGDDHDDDSALLSLIDYCARQLVRVRSLYHIFIYIYFRNEGIIQGGHSVDDYGPSFSSPSTMHIDLSFAISLPPLPLSPPYCQPSIINNDKRIRRYS